MKHRTKNSLKVIPFGGYALADSLFWACLRRYNEIRNHVGLRIIRNDEANQHVSEYYGTKYQFSRIVENGFLAEPFTWERANLHPDVIRVVRDKFLAEVGQILASRPIGIVPLSEEVNQERARRRRERFHVLLDNNNPIPDSLRYFIYGDSDHPVSNKDPSFVRFRNLVDVVWRELWLEYRIPGHNPAKWFKQFMGGRDQKIKFLIEIYQKGEVTKESIRESLWHRFGDDLQRMSDVDSSNSAKALEEKRISEQDALQQELRDSQPKLRTVQSRSNDKRGFVYVVISPTFPGWVKIGQTIDLNQRLVAFNTHNPHSDFSFAFYHGFPDRALAEKVIHKFFAKKRGPNGEWFQMTVEEARLTILELSEKFEEILAA